MLAAMLAAGTFLALYLLYPLTLSGRIEGEAAAQRACSNADTLEKRCGDINALSRSAAGWLLLIKKKDSLQLEAYEFVPPRRRKWSIKLPFSNPRREGGYSLAASSNGKHIGVGWGNDGWLLDGTTGSSLHPIEPCRMPRNRVHGVMRLAFAPDNRTLAVGQDAICIRSVDDDSEGVRIEIDGKGVYPVQNMIFEPSGQKIWVGAGHEVGLWNIHDRQRTMEIQSGGGSIALSSDGRRLATLGWNDLTIWDARTGKALGHLGKGAVGHGNPMKGALAFLPDGRHLAILSSYGYYIADPLNGTLSRQFETGTIYNTLAVGDGGVAFGCRGASGEPKPTFKFWSAAELLTSQPHSG